jgi:hypothetical protein
MYGKNIKLIRRAGSSRATPLVENRNQTAESSGDQKCQQSTKAGIPREGPAEEERCGEEDEKHHQKFPWFKSSQSLEPGNHQISSSEKN